MANEEAINVMQSMHRLIDVANSKKHTPIEFDMNKIKDQIAHSPIKFISCTEAQMYEMENPKVGTVVCTVDTGKLFARVKSSWHQLEKEEEEDIHHNMDDRKIKTRCDRCGGSLDITDHSLETGLAKCPYCRSLLYIYV